MSGIGAIENNRNEFAIMAFFAYFKKKVVLRSILWVNPGWPPQVSTLPALTP